MTITVTILKMKLVDLIAQLQSFPLALSDEPADDAFLAGLAPIIKAAQAVKGSEWTSNVGGRPVITVRVSRISSIFRITDGNYSTSIQRCILSLSSMRWWNALK